MSDFSSMFGGTGGGTWLSDWSMIKSGTYGRLMKSYYGMASGSSSSSTGEVSSHVVEDMIEERKHPKVSAEVQQANEDLTAKIPNFQSAVNSLQQDSLYEDSADGKTTAKDKVLSAMKNYVTIYNDTVNAAKKSTLSGKTAQVAGVMRLSDKFKDQLAEVGVTINSDGTLMLNEGKLKNSDLSKVQELFSKDNVVGYGSSVSARLNIAAASQGVSASENKNDGTGDVANSGAADLMKDAETLMSPSLFEKVEGLGGQSSYKMDDIVTSMNSFIEHFNEMLDADKSSDNSGLKSNLDSIRDKVQKNKDSLKAFGIDVDDNGKMKMNEFLFRQGDMSMFQTFFKGFYSGIASHVQLVDYYSTTNAGSKSSYNADGTYSAEGSTRYSDVV